MGLNKFNHLKINSGAKSSRFVVDLKQDLKALEAAETRNNKNLIVESRLEKLAELDYKKYFGAGKERVGMIAANFKNHLLEFGATASALPGANSIKQAAANRRGSRKTNLLVYGWRSLRRNNKWVSLLDQVAFVSLAKLFFIVFYKLFRLLYKVCYGAGWLTIFIFRFIYLILEALIKPFIKLINYLWHGFYDVLVKLLSRFLSGYKTRRSLPISKPVYFEQAEAEQTWSLPIRSRLSYLRPAIVFAGILLILVLPVKAYTYYKTIDSAKGKVLGASESAIDNLISGGQAAASLDFSRADQSFTSAGNNFLTAQNRLDEINSLLFVLASVIPNKNIQLAAASKNIARAGELSAAIGKNLSLVASSLFNYQPGGSNGILSNLSVYGHLVITDLTGLESELDQINSGLLPEAYQKGFILLKQKTAELNRGLSEFIGLADNLKSFLGGSMTKRYLLVFQNNSELRASGGFIGSFALVDFSNGKIKNLEVPGGGSYDTEAGLLKKIKSPEPLRLVRPDWHFWDANWWPDWPTSAKKLAWFYENSDGPTVDGVISFTPTVMERILKIIGPIDLKDKYGVVIDADNFWQVTQEFAEQKPNVTKQPKKIIGDLMNKIIEELPQRLSKNNLVDLLQAVEASFSDKNILLYFTDGELQAKAQELGWDGRLKETAGDYLSVINTNIAGGKSDRKIKQQIIHQAEIQPDGTIIDNLTIKRTHEAIKREPFSGVRNVDWLRIYVPLGSKLISAAGFKPVDKIFFKVAEEDWQDDPEIARAEASAITDEASATKIYNELDKTVFANWSQVDPGESIEINIKYQLPFKLTDKKSDSGQGLVDQLITKASAMIDSEPRNFYSYSMLIQKQPGMNSSTIESELKLSGNFQPIWKFPGDLSQDQNGWVRSENFEQDKLMAVLVEER